MFCKNGISTLIVNNRDGSPSGLFSVLKDFYKDEEFAYKEYLKAFSKINKPKIRVNDYTDNIDFNNYIKSLNKNQDLIEYESLNKNSFIFKESIYRNDDYLSSQIIGENVKLIFDKLQDIENFIKNINTKSTLQLGKDLFTSNNGNIYKNSQEIDILDFYDIEKNYRNNLKELLKSEYSKIKTNKYKILKSIDKTDYNRKLADLFISQINFISDNSVKFTVDKNSRYNLETDLIFIKSPYENVFLHEFTHNLTSYIFDKPDSELTNEEYEFKWKMVELYNKALPNKVSKSNFKYENYKYSATNKIVGKDGKEYYGLRDIQEFIAESLTNKEFQNYLLSIEENNNNILSELYKAFINMINYVKGNNNLLNSTMNTFEQFINKREISNIVNNDLNNIQQYFDNEAIIDGFTFRKVDNSLFVDFKSYNKTLLSTEIKSKRLREKLINRYDIDDFYNVSLYEIMYVKEILKEYKELIEKQNNRLKVNFNKYKDVSVEKLSLKSIILNKLDKLRVDDNIVNKNGVLLTSKYGYVSTLKVVGEINKDFRKRYNIDRSVIEMRKVNDSQYKIILNEDIISKIDSDNNTNKVEHLEIENVTQNVVKYNTTDTVKQFNDKIEKTNFIELSNIFGVKLNDNNEEKDNNSLYLLEILDKIDISNLESLKGKVNRDLLNLVTDYIKANNIKDKEDLLYNVFSSNFVKLFNKHGESRFLTTNGNNIFTFQNNSERIIISNDLSKKERIIAKLINDNYLLFKETYTKNDNIVDTLSILLNDNVGFTNEGLFTKNNDLRYLYLDILPKINSKKYNSIVSSLITNPLISPLLKFNKDYKNLILKAIDLGVEIPLFENNFKSFTKKYFGITDYKNINQFKNELLFSPLFNNRLIGTSESLQIDDKYHYQATNLLFKDIKTTKGLNTTPKDIIPDIVKNMFTNNNVLFEQFYNSLNLDKNSSVPYNILSNTINELFNNKYKISELKEETLDLVNKFIDYSKNYISELINQEYGFYKNIENSVFMTTTFDTLIKTNQQLVNKIYYDRPVTFNNIKTTKNNDSEITNIINKLGANRLTIKCD